MPSIADPMAPRIASFVLAFAMTSASLLAVDTALVSRDGVTRLVNTPSAVRA